MAAQMPARELQPVGRRHRAATISDQFFARSEPEQRLAPVSDAHESSDVDTNAAPARRRRSSSVAVRMRPRAQTASGGLSRVALDHSADLLEVLDERVAASSHLADISNAIFQPTSLLGLRPPEVALPSHAPEDEGDEATKRPSDDIVDEHLKHLALDKKEERRQALRKAWQGTVAFIKTPLGVFFAIYGFLVVVWGAALVLMLMIPFDAYQKALWIEIAAQILTALFTLTSGVMFFPRIWDTYNISIVAWMRWKTVRRRRNKGLPSLLDRNELPDPVPADSTLYEALVLTSREQAKLARAQARFCRSQTWYEPHHTPTHRPFSITWALWICVLNDGNSVFQWMLCGCMWGLDRFERPVWTTATLIPASFLCGIGAGVMIWRGGSRTKKQKEVTAEMWALLVVEEEKLQRDRKIERERAAQERRARRKARLRCW